MSHEPVYGPTKFADKKYAAAWLRSSPHLHVPFFRRPDVTRRNFFLNRVDRASPLLT